MVAGVVGHQDANAARAGQDGDVGVGRQRTGDCADIGDVQHFFNRLWPECAALRKNGVIHRVIAGQRAGVCGRGGRTDFGAASLHDENGFTGFGRFQQSQPQAVAVLAGLDGGAYDFGFRVFGQVIDALGHINVGLIAGRHDLRKAQAAQRCHAIGCRAKGAALGGQCDMALDGAQAIECSREGSRKFVGQVEQAKRIGAQHAHAVFAADVHQFLLLLFAGFIDFGETRGQDLYRLDALAHGFAQRGFHTCCRDDDDGLVNRAGYVRDVFIGFQALHQCFPLVDRVDGALVITFEHEAQHAAAYALGVGRGAYQRDGPGEKKRVKCVHVEGRAGKFQAGRAAVFASAAICDDSESR